jgi:hypothetical protein
LRQTEIALFLFDAAAEYVAIKMGHGFDVRRPNDDVIDFADMDFHVGSPMAGSRKNR